jgi:chorismate mutase
MANLLVVTDDADRATLAEAIGHLKRKFDRMPAHWEARRLEVMREIERLIDRWLALDA